MAGFARMRLGFWLFGALTAVMVGFGVPAHAQEWVNVATVSNTAGSLTAGRLCVNDGRDIVCGTTSPALDSATGGLTVSGPLSVAGNAMVSGTTYTEDLHVRGSLYVSGSQSIDGVTFANGGVQATGTVSATGFSGDGGGLYNIPASAVGYADRIVSGTSSVAVAQDGAVSVTIGGANVANFGAGGLGVTAVNASGVVASAGVNSSAGISGTTGYFSGNVGVGTTPGSSKLYVNGTGQFGTLFLNNADGYGNRILENSTSNLSIATAGTGTPRIFLHSSTGNIGINTTAPAATLQVSGTFIVSTTGQNTTPSLYVGSNGYVGVGTSSPAANLQVNGTTGVRVSGGTSAGQIQFTGAYGILTNASGDLYIDNQAASGKIIFRDNGSSEKMRIDSAGNVGIGTTAPSSTLHVSGTLMLGGSGATACDGTVTGAMRWQSGRLEVCTLYQ